MGEFKPLLEVGGEPLIHRTVRSALAGGVQEVRVVLGREAEQVRAALADLSDLVFVENPLYASTDMFRSVQLAMRDTGVADGAALRDAILGKAPKPAECLRTRLSGHQPDALFILPGDMAAILPRTFEILAEYAADTSNPPLLRPLYHGGHGHPLLVRREAFLAILAYDGAATRGEADPGDRGGGLKAALAGFELAGIEVPDQGVLLDADTPADLERLREYVNVDQ
jgi:molybdenum cofactor cytidylyltransferase